MPEPVAEIPNRPAFKAAEVCEIAQIPPYVLRSWEKEFPGLGTVVKPGGPRVYRRADVEQVLRIKHLLFSEGLTLAGARRKLEGEPKVEDELLPDPVVADELRAKVGRIKRELRSLLDLLSDDATRAEGATREVAPPASATTDSAPTDSAASDRGGSAATATASVGTGPEAEHVPSWPPVAAKDTTVGSAGQHAPAPEAQEESRLEEGGPSDAPGPGVGPGPEFVLEHSGQKTGKRPAKSRKAARKAE